MHLHSAVKPHSVEDLTNEVLATAYLLQQQIHALESLAHATEEREVTLLQQRSKLQELLRLVTHMETTEAHATASLQETLFRIRTGKVIRSLSTLRLSTPASPFPGLTSDMSLAPPSSFSLDVTPPRSTGGASDGELGGPGDVSESASLQDEKAAENCDGNGGEQSVTQGNVGAGNQVDTDGEANVAARTPSPLASIKAEEGSGGECVQKIDPSTANADAIVSSGGSAQANHSVGEDLGRDRVKTEPGAVLVEVDGQPQGKRREQQPETPIRFDPRLLSAPNEAIRVQSAPTPFKGRDEPAQPQKGAADAEGSWRARKPTPSSRTRSGRWREREVAPQNQAREPCATQSIPAGVTGPSAAARTRKGGKKGRSGDDAGTQRKRPQNTPSPRKVRVSGSGRAIATAEGRCVESLLRLPFQEWLASNSRTRMCR